jgi:hypothetical protein
MRIWDMALFMYCLNFTVVLIAALGLVPGYQLQGVDWVLPSVTVVGAVSSVSAAMLFGDWVAALGFFTATIAPSIIVLGTFLTQMGFPSTLATGIQGIATLVYLGGLIQFIANRSFKGSD